MSKRKGEEQQSADVGGEALEAIEVAEPVEVSAETDDLEGMYPPAGEAPASSTEELLERAARGEEPPVTMGEVLRAAESPSMKGVLDAVLDSGSEEGAFPMVMDAKGGVVEIADGVGEQIGLPARKGSIKQIGVFDTEADALGAAEKAGPGAWVKKSGRKSRENFFVYIRLT